MESAAERRERLKALRQAAQLTENNTEDSQPEKPLLKLRNYKLRDKTIDHEQVLYRIPMRLASVANGFVFTDDVQHSALIQPALTPPSHALVDPASTTS